mgnify:CR=1 FL=1
MTDFTMQTDADGAGPLELVILPPAGGEAPRGRRRPAGARGAPAPPPAG